MVSITDAKKSHKNLLNDIYDVINQALTINYTNGLCEFRIDELYPN